MFERATRLKLRFPFKGPCTVEDLWDLSVTALDGIYKALRNAQKEMDGESLLSEKKENATLALQVDIVKHIVTVKQAEAEDKRRLVERKAQKERILEIIAQKQDESLKGKSVEELTALLNGL
jgi:hypothetical protein